MKTKLSLKELLDKTGRTQYIDYESLKSAPEGDGEVEFFTLSKHVSDDELEKEYESRGLIPASIRSLCELDIKNPEILDEKKHVVTHWKDGNGKLHFATFTTRDDGGRGVYISHFIGGWSGGWWFAAYKKPKVSDLESAIAVVKKEGYLIYKQI